MKTTPRKKSEYKRTETVVIQETKVLVSSTEECRQYRKWKQRDAYYIKIEGQLVPVTPEVYDAYHYYENHAQPVTKKEAKNVHSYNFLDTDDLLGENMFPDKSSESIEDSAITNLLIEQLRQHMA